MDFANSCRQRFQWQAWAFGPVLEELIFFQIYWSTAYQTYIHPLYENTARLFEHLLHLPVELET